MSAPEKVLELVERFDRGRHTYSAPAYNETQVRREFLDPMFACLGWDIDNRAGYAEAYKDVVHEDRVRISGASKAPDYSFRVGGMRKFFVEAKKPSVNLKDDPLPAYQLRRYAWSAKLPLSILTDFDEFVVYDCRDEPKRSDKASAKRLLYIRSSEYATRWSEIADVFSKDAVMLGSFDSYAVSLKGKRGTAQVDQIFLAEMEEWREALARNLVLRNDLTQRELNFAVQQIIDRIVFLRICEDRGIESFGELQGALGTSDVYAELVRLFLRADDRYNSGLFHFKMERGRSEMPDSITLGLTIDNSALKRIITRLYFPESPYEFKVLPADILGQVYEQFLGKVIHKRSARRIEVEEKPEVKKAGGIVYTPTFVVDYIVEQSLGRLLQTLSLDRAQGTNSAKDAHPLRVLDPACGSGSFLIAAYQRLLDWYLDRYRETPEKWSKGRRPKLRRSETGEWTLSAQERRRILVMHIFGVDVDGQAVEVTKLSLLLKVLEGESEETLGQQRTLFQERALPDLGNNIRCGNSLIASDFNSYRASTLFDEDEELRVNAFDWSDEFPAIIKQSKGFDVVLGNPPYVLLQDEFRDDEQLAYFRDSYTVASYKLDLYHLFMERGLTLTRHGGVFSMITPANFLTNNYLDRLRALLLEESRIDHIAVIERGVFPGRSVDNAIYVVQAGGPSAEEFDLRSVEPGPLGWTATSTAFLSPDTIRASTGTLMTGSGSAVRDAFWSRLEAASDRLGTIASVNFGKQLRDRKVFTKDVVTVDKLAAIKPPYRPCYTGSDVQHYSVEWSGLACLDSEDARRGGCWDRSKQDAVNKLVTKQIGRYPDFGLDEHGHQCLNTIFMVNIEHDYYSPHFLLAYLNSAIVRAYWVDRFYDRRRTFPKIKGTYLKDLPVLALSRSSEDRRLHDALDGHAINLIALHERLKTVRTSQEETRIRRAIHASERVIDTALLDRLEASAQERESVIDAAA
jgi:hypothetical protein